MADRILHVSIGPVQSFVAQARRTRDLWAGSFLLSWLAGQFMTAVLRQGGRILFPVVGTEERPEDPMLAAILRPLKQHDPVPRIGTLPNRFKASVTEAFEPEAAADLTRRKWQSLTESVWRRFLGDTEDQGRDTRTIWNRQVNGFWDIQWVIGDDPEDGSDAAWLDARKNWRSHWPSLESGDHCTSMGEWQELSGFIRSREWRRQDAFWNALQHKVGRLDLRDGERLCAVALVKRLFPKLDGPMLEQTVGWPTGALNWPSTAYMAAVPWLVRCAGDPKSRAELLGYVDIVRDAVSTDTFAKLTGERAAKLPGLNPLGEAANLDGNLFLGTALANARATPLNNNQVNDDQIPGSEDDGNPDAVLRKRLSNALAKLGERTGSCAKPFYGLLAMDGDRLGKLLREKGERSVSRALTDFVRNVPDIVTENNGITIYAGGDDVLAMLPIDRAIECAISLRQTYGAAFENLGISKVGETGNPATASTAVVFAHYRNPLREVLMLAHGELDNTAKACNGRDSLALAVMLTGGVNHRWVGRFGTLPEAILTLRDGIATGDYNYSTSFFYHLRQRYAAMTAGLDPNDFRAMVLGEYVKGAPPKDNDAWQRAEVAVDIVLSACRRQQGEEMIDPDASFQFDGIFIARFLAETGSFGPRKAPE